MWAGRILQTPGLAMPQPPGHLMPTAWATVARNPFTGSGHRKEGAVTAFHTGIPSDLAASLSLPIAWQPTAMIVRHSISSMLIPVEVKPGAESMGECTASSNVCKGPVTAKVRTLFKYKRGSVDGLYRIYDGANVLFSDTSMIHF